MERILCPSCRRSYKNHRSLNRHSALAQGLVWRSTTKSFERLDPQEYESRLHRWNVKMGNPPSFVPGSDPFPPPPLVKREGQPGVPEGLGSSQIMVEPLTEGPQLPSPQGVQVGEERHFLDWPRVTQNVGMATLQHSDVSIRGFQLTDHVPS